MLGNIVEHLRTPAAHGIAVPFAGTVAWALASRFAGGRYGRRLAVAGIGITVLIAYGFIQGIAFPPVTSMAKLFYVAAFGFALGVVLDVTDRLRLGGEAAALLLPAAALAWLVWARHDDLWFPGVLLFFVGVTVFRRMIATEPEIDEAAADGAALFAPVLLLIAAVAVAAIASIGGAAPLAALAAALAWATGGFLLVLFALHLFGEPPPLRFGAAGTFGGAGALLGIVFVAVLYHEGPSRGGLALLLLSFVVDAKARALALAALPGPARTMRALRPVFYASLVGLPALAAVVYAFIAQAPKPG